MMNKMEASFSPSGQRIMTPAKGSWEEKLLRGQELLAKQDESGRVLLQQLIERLFQTPESMRMAGNQRLNNLLLMAIDSLALYLLSRDQFAEAAALLQKGEEVLSAEQRNAWRFRRATVLLLGERQDEGFALLKALILSEEDLQKRFLLWDIYLDKALHRRRFDLAEQALLEIERSVNRASATLDDAAQARAFQSDLAYFKARLSLAQNRVDEALAWMEYAAAQAPLTPGRIYRFVLELIERNRCAEALKWVQRDQENPLRIKFLSGYIHFHLGERAEAERLWRQVVRTFPNAAESETVDMMPIVLSDYYLGGKERLGLGVVLGSMQAQDTITATQFYLAGLGWAMRGEKFSAHSNFKLALMRTKMLAIALKLPQEWWLFCKDLIPAADLPEYEVYFETSSSF